MKNKWAVFLGCASMALASVNVFAAGPSCTLNVSMADYGSISGMNAFIPSTASNAQVIGGGQFFVRLQSPGGLFASSPVGWNQDIAWQISSNQTCNQALGNTSTVAVAYASVSTKSKMLSATPVSGQQYIITISVPVGSTNLTVPQFGNTNMWNET